MHSPFSRHKLLRYWPSLDRIMHGDPAEVMPVTVELDLHNQCNHNCVWCIVRGYRTSSRASLSVDDVDAIARGLAEVGVKGVILSGSGEPTIHPAFRECVLRLRQAGLALALETNGACLDRDGARFVAASFEWARISLDAATADVHSATHGCRPTDFPRILEAIGELVSARQAGLAGRHFRVAINFTAYSGNHHQIVQATTLARDLGVDWIAFRVALFPGDPTPLSSIEGTFREAEALAATFPSLLVRTSVRNHARANQGLLPCRALGLFAAIAASGDVFACCEGRGHPELHLGNALADGFPAVMHGKRRAELLRAMCRAVPPLCLRICNGRFDTYNEMLEYLLSSDPPHVEFV
jgi:MoaA/NifB/PqqE/SkfB family radical SAM enzyme